MNNTRIFQLLCKKVICSWIWLTIANNCWHHVLFQTEISKESEMVENFECKQTLKQRYRLALLRPSIKPLAAALKVSVRMDVRGFLCLQFMIKTESHHICFIEYFVSIWQVEDRLTVHKLQLYRFFCLINSKYGKIDRLAINSPLCCSRLLVCIFMATVMLHSSNHS